MTENLAVVYSYRMKMEHTIITEEVPNVDFSKVAALQQKRTLAFVNHFVITITQSLNNFLYKCEQSLMQFEQKLEKVEAAMILLETRLASIPEVNTDDFDNKQEQSNTSTVQAVEQINHQDDTQHNSSQTQENVQEPSKEEMNKTSSDDAAQQSPEYERFVKMVQVGVPLEAVKLKVSLEGLDPNILEKILKK